MPDPTGPELLDALERLYAAVSLHEDIICELGDSPRCMTMVNDIILAWGETPADAISRLRSLLRTPEETAVLRAAVRAVQGKTPVDIWWLVAQLGWRVIDLPPERRAELMKEDKTDA
jgi:hypothetical protein